MASKIKLKRPNIHTYMIIILHIYIYSLIMDLYSTIKHIILY